MIFSYSKFFSISGLLLFITSGALILVLIVYGTSFRHRLWTFFNFSVAWWGIFAFYIGNAIDEDRAVFLWKFAFIGVNFIAVFFYHFSKVFCEIRESKWIIRLIYFQALFFALLPFSGNLYISKVSILNREEVLRLWVLEVRVSMEKRSQKN